MRTIKVGAITVSRKIEPAPVKHGHDGERPEFMPVRDLAGAGKRETQSIVNANVDRLEWLLAHKRIELYQHQAGRKLQHDAELATIGGFASIGGTGGGAGNVLSDAKCDAIARVNAARIAMGNSGWRILELVVLEGSPLNRAEARMRLRSGSGITALTVALDSLARHYGLA